jgi:ZIP family zinc transporter
MLNIPPTGWPWILLSIGLATGLATLVGGMLALRLRSWLPLLIGFGAGAVLGVSLFDLLPEALTLGAQTASPFDLTSAALGGFAVYLVVDRAMDGLSREGVGRGHLGAAALTAHSLMDGFGIGLAFQVSATAGAILAAAVLAHDLLDGANTVTLVFSGGGRRDAARGWLVADALAPLFGIGLASLVEPSQGELAVLLAVFAGFFLYIGASDLLPQAKQHRPAASTSAATLLGLGLIYLVIRFSGG